MGRGSSGRGGSVIARNMAGRASVQQIHTDAIRQLSSDQYSDGTYNLGTLTPVEYNDGFQVTFCQIGDNYTPQQYEALVNRFTAVSSDGIVSAGKFGGDPEISFHVADRATAEALAREFNQISIWDWNASDEISTGGTGRRR